MPQEQRDIINVVEKTHQYVAFTGQQTTTPIQLVFIMSYC